MVTSAHGQALQNFNAWLRSSINRRKKRGPRTDLWGTTRFILVRPKVVIIFNKHIVAACCMNIRKVKPSKCVFLLAIAKPNCKEISKEKKTKAVGHIWFHFLWETYKFFCTLVFQAPF